MVLKEACNVMVQFLIRLHKVVIGRIFFSGFGVSSVLCRFSCIRKSGIDDRKVHLKILQGFLEHRGWVWER